MGAGDLVGVWMEGVGWGGVGWGGVWNVLCRAGWVGLCIVW